MTLSSLRGAARALMAAVPFFLIHTPVMAAAGGRLGGGQSLEISLGRIVGALVVSIIVVLLAVLLIKQRGGKIDLSAWLGKVRLRERALDVVEARRVSPHADVCVIRHQGTEYLLLLSAGNSQLLSRVPVVATADSGEDS